MLAYTKTPQSLSQKKAMGPSPGTLVPFIHSWYGDLSPEKLQCGTPNHDPFPGYDSLYPEMVIWCHLVNGVLIFPASPYDFLVFATKKNREMEPQNYSPAEALEWLRRKELPSSDSSNGHGHAAPGNLKPMDFWSNHYENRGESQKIIRRITNLKVPQKAILRNHFLIKKKLQIKR